MTPSSPYSPPYYITGDWLICISQPQARSLSTAQSAGRDVIALIVTGKGDVTISADDDDMPKLMTGRLNPQQVDGLHESQFLLCCDIAVQFYTVRRFSWFCQR